MGGTAKEMHLFWKLTDRLKAEKGSCGNDDRMENKSVSLVSYSSWGRETEGNSV